MVDISKLPAIVLYKGDRTCIADMNSNGIPGMCMLMNPHGEGKVDVRMMLTRELNEEDITEAPCERDTSKTCNFYTFKDTGSYCKGRMAYWCCSSCMIREFPEQLVNVWESDKYPDRTKEDFDADVQMINTAHMDFTEDELKSLLERMGKVAENKGWK